MIRSQTHAHSYDPTHAYPAFAHHANVSAIVRHWRPVMRCISALTGDSSFLVVRCGFEALCIHREYGAYPIQVLTVTPGQRQPLGIGAGGLALLAALPPYEAEDAIRSNAIALRAYSGMTTDMMTRLTEETRARGWAVVDRAATPGLAGVGIACCDTGGYPLVGLSLASSRDRMPSQRQLAIAAVLRDYASQAGQAA